VEPQHRQTDEAHFVIAAHDPFLISIQLEALA
jgi:hypothetical protein